MHSNSCNGGPDDQQFVRGVRLWDDFIHVQTNFAIVL